MKYKAVIFDLFGTLVQNLSSREFDDMLSAMAEMLSVPAPDFIRLWNETWEKRRIGFFSTLEGDIDHICQILDNRPGNGLLSEAAEVRKAFARRVLTRTRSYALQKLNSLKESGYKTGVISNCAADVPSVWAGTHLARGIDVPIFSSSVRLKKPDRQIYVLACEKLALPPEQCIYVADGNERELTGASQAGMYPILFRGPDRDPYDQGLDREEWSGTAISDLRQILNSLTVSS